jgi:hypothetical protein
VVAEAQASTVANSMLEEIAFMVVAEEAVVLEVVIMALEELVVLVVMEEPQDQPPQQDLNRVEVVDLQQVSLHPAALAKLS